VPRVVAAIIAVTLAVAFFANPAPADAKPNQKPPKPSPPSSGQFLPGIDVSYHQGSINWSRVAGAGVGFAYIRSSAGTLTSDAEYANNRAAARAAGLAAGAYHFGNPDSAPNDAANEASWFLQNAAIRSGDLLPVLDLEVSNGLGESALTAWAQSWLEEVEAATGVKPIVYTNRNFWSGSMANTDWFARNGYRLWIAHWTTATQPTLPASDWAGQGWTFWQHSSTGTVPGISGNVDLDRFNGKSLPESAFVP
jgi:GH25 family lysozyme M1 (1,4-beta-N-acetylmuramidase)